MKRTNLKCFSIYETNSTYWRNRRNEIYANEFREPNVTVANIYYEAMNAYIESLRSLQFSLRDDILWVKTHKTTSKVLAHNHSSKQRLP